MNILKILILIGGFGFILYSIFFSGSSKSKFTSDLPKDKKKPFYKTAKGIVLLCLLILLVIFSVYLIASLLI